MRIRYNMMAREHAIFGLLFAGCVLGYSLEWRLNFLSQPFGGGGNGAVRSIGEEWTERISHNVVARGSNWTAGDLPCFEPDAAMMSEYGFQQPATSGFLFLKLPKTGGSTAAGMAMRIAKHVAERTHQDFEMCRGRWDHAWAFRMLQDRQRDQSFTWTMLRDPTKRAISEFNHFEVSRNGQAASSFVSYLKSHNHNSLYLRELSIDKHNAISNPEAPALINEIISEYDFMGITERMDESAVALMMLTGAKLGDILYLSAKGSGSYDDGAYENKCFFIKPFRMTMQVRQFLESDLWRDVVKWDNLLYSTRLPTGHSI